MHRGDGQGSVQFGRLGYWRRAVEAGAGSGDPRTTGAGHLIRRGFFVRGRMGGMDENPYESPEVLDPKLPEQPGASMSRYLAIAAACGAGIALCMSLVYNGVGNIDGHVFAMLPTAGVSLVPGFLIWLAVQQHRNRKS
jgi:hypothetical protein